MEARLQLRVDEYLAELRDELEPLPAEQGEEVFLGVAEHIDEATAVGRLQSEADLMNLLDQVGSPAEIAREAGVSREPSTQAAEAAPSQGSWEAIGQVLLSALRAFVGFFVILWTFGVAGLANSLIGPVAVVPALLIYGVLVWLVMRNLYVPEGSDR